MGKKGRKTKKKDNFWLDSEDDRLRRRFREAGPKFSLEEEAAPKPKLQIPKEVTVTVPRIQIPKTVTIKVPRIDPKKIKKLPRHATPLIKKYKWWMMAGCAAFVLLVGFQIFSAKPGGKSGKKSATGASKTAAKPDFTVVVPLTKKASGGDLGVKFSPDKKTASLQDNYYGKTVTISEQQLPKALASDPSTLIKASNSIAQVFNVSLIERQSIVTDQGDLYFYNIPKSTEQRGVMQYGDILIFFHTDKQLDKDDWLDFEKGLAPAS